MGTHLELPSMPPSGPNARRGGSSHSRRGPAVAALISRARHGHGSSIGALLQLYRNYMTVLAATQLDRRLQPRVSPSDIVQETMLRAHAAFGQFRGATEPELMAWLR